MGALRQDIRFGWRQLLKHPGFTGLAILSMALGIGANTAIFSLVDTVLLRPLPVREPSQLIAVDGQLRRLRADIPPLAWSYVIAEKRATYACTPRRPRVAGPRLAPGVYVCGDYVDAEFPATLEAAVRSGIAAARAVIADAP